MRLRLAEGVNPADFPLANSRVSRNPEELQEGFLKRRMKIRLIFAANFIEDVFDFYPQDDAGNCQRSR